jgi:hypothetical protein
VLHQPQMVMASMQSLNRDFPSATELGATND